MLRISNMIAALAILLVSLDALALGLGGLRTQSALNSPFYGEIDLIGVDRDELDTVSARLASAEEFEKAGIDRPHFLTRLRFVTMIGTSGRPIIQITSRESIREPYLDFLVEVIWPEGTIVKEYAVLLDPPGTTGRSAPAIAEPQVAVLPGQALDAPEASGPEPGPAPSTDDPGLLPPAVTEQDELVDRDAGAAGSVGADQAAPTDSASAPSPQQGDADATAAGAGQTIASTQAPASQANPESTAPAVAEAETPAGPQYPLRYGPVKPGDGLWRVARQLTPPGATVEQTAMALYRTNQHAFVGGDINKLIVGQPMSVPSEAELLALNDGEAKSEFRRAVAGKGATAKPLAEVVRPVAEPPEETVAEDPEEIVVEAAEEAVAEASEEIVAKTPEEAVAEVAERPAGEPRIRIVGARGAGLDDAGEEPAATVAEAIGAGADTAGSSASPSGVPSRQVVALQQDLLLVQEESEANRQESEALRERIGGLEERLEYITRLLELQAGAKPPGEGEEANRDQTERQPLKEQRLPHLEAVVQKPDEPELREPKPEVAPPVAPAPGLFSSLISGIPWGSLLITALVITVGALGTVAWRRRQHLVTTSPDDELFTETAVPEPPPPPSPPPPPPPPSPPSPPPAQAKPQPPATMPSRVMRPPPVTPPAPDRAAPRRPAAAVAPERPAPVRVEPPPATPALAQQPTAAAPAASAPKTSVPASESDSIPGQTMSVEYPEPDESSRRPPPQLHSVQSAKPHGVDVHSGFAFGAGSSVVPGQAETQEADVISEADIYILYGRYREAESLLAEELDAAPERVDVKYKLAEAYVAGENRRGLASLVEQMRGAGEDAHDPARWEGILQGLESIPEDAGAGRSLLPAARGEPPRARRSAGRSRLEREPVAEPPSDLIELAEAADAVDHDSDTPAESSNGHPLHAELGDGMEVELKDLDEIGPISEEPSLADREAVEASLGVDGMTTDVDALDLDLDFGGPDVGRDDLPAAPASPKAVAQRGAVAEPIAAAGAADVLDDELSIALDRPIASTGFSPPAARAAKPVSVPDPEPEPAPLVKPFAADDGLEDPMLGVADEGSVQDSEEPGLEDSISADVLSSQWRADSGLWDEAGTKMDLARAYIEMDDADAARAILEEVIAEGSRDQQQAAGEMLKEIG